MKKIEQFERIKVSGMTFNEAGFWEHPEGRWVIHKDDAKGVKAFYIHREYGWTFSEVESGDRRYCCDVANYGYATDDIEEMAAWLADEIEREFSDDGFESSKRWLRAAAPELRDACDEALRFMREYFTDENPEANLVMEEISKALKKANKQ